MTELEGLDRTIERGMARAKTPGVSLGLIRPGHEPFAKGYGYRDREAKLPATPRTVYGIASVTKSFSASRRMASAVNDFVTEAIP